MYLLLFWYYYVSEFFFVSSSKNYLYKLVSPFCRADHTTRLSIENTSTFAINKMRELNYCQIIYTEFPSLDRFTDSLIIFTNLCI